MTDQADAKATAYGCLATIVLFIAVGVGSLIVFRGPDPEEAFASAVMHRSLTMSRSRR